MPEAVVTATVLVHGGTPLRRTALLAAIQAIVPACRVLRSGSAAEAMKAFAAGPVALVVLADGAEALSGWPAVPLLQCLADETPAALAARVQARLAGPASS